MTTWTDNPATAGTRIRSVHITELRAAIDDALYVAGLPPVTWTDPVLDVNTRVRAVHFNEARSALATLWNFSGLGPLPDWTIGSGPSDRRVSARDITDLRDWYDRYDPDTMIGANFLNTSRDFHTKSPWNVELVYKLNPDPETTDFAKMADRISAMKRNHKEVKILLRLDYSGPGPDRSPAPRLKNRSIPAQGDSSALNAYLQFLQDVCKEPKFADNVYGYIIGNEFNSSDENDGDPSKIISAQWYSDVFIGSERDASDTNNAFQTIKAIVPSAKVLIGPVAPYNSQKNCSDENEFAYGTAPAYWLNYFNEVCNRISSKAGEKGIVLDGVAIHAYGRTGLSGSDNGGKDEPHNRYSQTGFHNAMAGFQAFQDWLDVMSHHPGGGLSSSPVYITETNTSADGISSNQTYPRNPRGWYIEAWNTLKDKNLSISNRIKALCWFVDDNYDTFWGDYSLQQSTHYIDEANDDFNDALSAPEPPPPGSS